MSKFRLYKKIDKYMQIVIGADCSEGLKDGDFSAAVARDIYKNEVIMTYHARVDAYSFANDLKMMGNYCNKAWIAPENNGVGYAIVSDLYKIYGNVFRMESTDANGTIISNKLGFTTTTQSKPQILSQLKEEIKEGAITLNDSDLIEELLTFVSKDGKLEAGEGKHDDFVMACAISGYLRLKKPYSETLNKRLHNEYIEDENPYKEYPGGRKLPNWMTK